MSRIGCPHCSVFRNEFHCLPLIYFISLFFIINTYHSLISSTIPSFEFLLFLLANSVHHIYHYAEEINACHIFNPISVCQDSVEVYMAMSFGRNRCIGCTKGGTMIPEFILVRLKSRNMMVDRFFQEMKQTAPKWWLLFALDDLQFSFWSFISSLSPAEVVECLLYVYCTLRFLKVVVQWWYLFITFWFNILNLSSVSYLA